MRGGSRGVTQSRRRDNGGGSYFEESARGARALRVLVDSTTRDMCRTLGVRPSAARPNASITTSYLRLLRLTLACRAR